MSDPTAIRARRGWREAATAVGQLGRTSLLGTTFAFVLFGAGSAGGRRSAGEIGLALVGAITFHVAAYAWNDVVDLPHDREDRRRAASPLVRGSVRPAAVAAGATGSAAVALAIAFVHSVLAGIAMAIGLSLLLLYDVFGKRVRMSPVTDALQGLGWAALVAYGAAAVGRPTSVTAWTALAVMLLIVLTNGVHGSLRDLPSDARSGAKTTALLLGAVPLEPDGARITARLAVYAITVHAAIVASVVAGLLDEPGAVDRGRLAVAVAGGAACMALLAWTLATTHLPARSLRSGLAHMVLVLLLPLPLVSDRLDSQLTALLLVLFIGSWLFVAASLPRRLGARELTA